MKTKVIKLNFWTFWKIIALIVIVSNVFFSYGTEMSFWSSIIIYLLATGFRNIEDAIEEESNIFKLEWSRK